MIIGRMVDALRKANYGALVLEIFVLSVGILLALAVDRWNQDRLDAIETRRIVERLESDTARNLAMFDTTLPGMIENLENLKVFFQALDTGSMTEKNRPMIENAIVGIDVIPSYPLVFSGYEELVATGRLRQLDDPTDALDEYVDFYFTSERMNEDGMGVRFDFELLAADRNLKNNIFGAVDIHGDWLNAQNRIYEVTKKIDLELKNQPH
jgi:hypothetical protein